MRDAIQPASSDVDVIMPSKGLLFASPNLGIIGEVQPRHDPSAKLDKLAVI